MFDSRYFFPPKEIPPPKDTKTLVESPIPISPSYHRIFSHQLDNSLWIIPRPLGSEPVPEESNESALGSEPVPEKPNESDAC
ncbi:hypothetical protein Tco_0707412 [Tanacetum coccineum]|uniref:Uncharacterized protein n=1 Tax=Tanacetum coccineum TaxID=301880 RepID=A0ABQ4YB78_9ASTR